MMVPSKVRRWAIGAFLAYLAVVIVVVFGLKLSEIPLLDLVGETLRRFQDHGLLLGVRFGHVEAAANVLFFIPLGILLPLVYSRPRFLAGWLCAVGLSIGIELVQFFFLASRVGSVRDVICNVAGAAFGTTLTFVVLQISTRRKLPAAKAMKPLVDDPPSST